MDASTQEHPEEHGVQNTASSRGQDAGCHCSHRRTIPVLAIIVGLEFFLAEIGIFTWGFVNVTWPLLVVIAGIAGLRDHRCRCHGHCQGK